MVINKREQRRRLRLMRKARKGNVGALCILREKYHLRLPLVERRLPYVFPWMRGEGGAARPPAGGL